jgi:DNA-binding FrmR family transcriptional regulator
MELTEEQSDQLIARLRRVEGQLRGIQGMIQDGRECTEVVTQFAAAIKALEQAGYKYFATTLTQCALDPAKAEAQGYTAESLERMFLQLS